MAEGYEVLEMLIPTGGWEIKGNDYSGITFLECDPISEEQFNAGFAKVDAWKEQQKAELETNKAAAEAKLVALGLDANDLKALGLG